MATTAIWDVKGWIGQVVYYVENPAKTENPDFSGADIQGLRDVMNYATQDYKTEKQFYVSGINCMPETARQQMMMTKKRWAKEGGIVAFHGYQSFAPGEVTPELAHEIGMNLAQELWGDRFEVIVATHLDKCHLHSHFVINSVSFRDGKRYNDCKATYSLIRHTSDRLCQEYGLSIIENPKPGKHRSYDAWQAEHDGKPTWWSLIREDVDKAIRQSMTFTQFINHLRELGYEIKQGKYLAVRPEGKDRFVRLKTLGDDYTEVAITRRILQQLPERNVQPFHPAAKHGRYNGVFQHPRPSVKGLRALYLHYVFLLRKALRQPAVRRVSFLLREDIRKMDEYSEQARFLCKYRIDTKEQLIEWLKDRDKEKNRLISERTAIGNHIRCTKDETRLTEFYDRRKDITAQLSDIRSKLKLAKNIQSRSNEAQEKILNIKRSQHMHEKQKIRTREQSARR